MWCEIKCCNLNIIRVFIDFLFDTSVGRTCGPDVFNQCQLVNLSLFCNVKITVGKLDPVQYVELPREKQSWTVFHSHNVKISSPDRK